VHVGADDGPSAEGSIVVVDDVDDVDVDEDDNEDDNEDVIVEKDVSEFDRPF
jgi:hypothetical protein